MSTLDSPIRIHTVFLSPSECVKERERKGEERGGQLRKRKREEGTGNGSGENEKEKGKEEDVSDKREREEEMEDEKEEGREEAVGKKRKRESISLLSSLSSSLPLPSPPSSLPAPTVPQSYENLILSITKQTAGFFKRVPIPLPSVVTRLTTDLHEDPDPNCVTQANELTALLKDTFDLLVSQYLLPYRGTLFLGHLRTRIHLHPSPHLALVPNSINGMDSAVSFPSLLSIIGFLPLSFLIGAPATSIHVVFPDPLSAVDASSATSSSNGKSQPLSRVNPFIYMLFEALNRESAGALIRLGDGGRYCLIVPHSERKSAALLLVILRRGVTLPGLGPIDNLTTKKEGSLFLHPFPNLEELMCNTMISKTYGMSKDVLAIHFQSLVELSRSLPDSLEEMFEKCEIIRQISFLHLCPHLLTVTGSFLKYLVSQRSPSGHTNDLASIQLLTLAKEMLEGNLNQECDYSESCTH